MFYLMPLLLLRKSNKYFWWVIGFSIGGVFAFPLWLVAMALIFIGGEAPEAQEKVEPNLAKKRPTYLRVVK